MEGGPVVPIGVQGIREDLEALPLFTVTRGSPVAHARDPFARGLELHNSYARAVNVNSQVRSYPKGLLGCFSVKQDVYAQKVGHVPEQLFYSGSQASFLLPNVCAQERSH